MRFLSKGLCWLTFVFAACAPLRADTARLVNGSTNYVLTVVSFAGEACVAPGGAVVWPVDGSGVTNMIAGTNAGSWVPLYTHEYSVCLSRGGTVSVVDQAGPKTSIFWWGFSVMFVLLLMCWGAGWSGRVVAPGAEVG